MRALVVYESMFGNTQAIAEAVAEGLSTLLDTQVTEVGDAPNAITDVALVVVGGPTHAFGLTRPGTRADAARRAGHQVVSTRRGLREWFEVLEPHADGFAFATFDTRIDKPRVPGAASKAADRRLRRHGGRPVVGPESFWVDAVDGPLLPGEIERARSWGARLAVVMSSEDRPALRQARLRGSSASG